MVMAKGEISWRRQTAEGTRVQVYAHRAGDRWHFSVRERRFDQWTAMPEPALEDWLALLDGVQRRIRRRLMRPEEEDRLKKAIRERFPETAL
jgi:hypothetical protein